MSAPSLQISRPAPGTSTGRVWEIADAITGESGRKATRAEVIHQYQAEGGNYNTASTQYHYWKSQYETHAENPFPNSISQPHSLQVKEAGRIILPTELRTLLGIREGDTLTAKVIEGEIRLMPLQTAIRKAQQLVRSVIPEGVSLVDQLIDERRAEAIREERR